VTERRVVPDASVAVKSFLDEPGSAAARRLRDEDGLDLHVPDIWYLEIGNVFWKRRRRGEAGFTSGRLGELLELLAVVPVTAHPSRDLVHRSVGIALEAGLSVYDASYVAVAESQGATLVTADAHLAGRAKEWSTVAVDLLPV
jgi:predicted nucleic acid-binding protein